MDQHNSQEIIEKIYGNNALFIPYIMPGFILAKKAKMYLEKYPKCKLIILDKHGIFTFGETAKSSYDAMINFVTKAERFIASNKSQFVKQIKSFKNNAIFTIENIAPIIRGILKNFETSDYRNNIIFSMYCFCYLLFI